MFLNFDCLIFFKDEKLQSVVYNYKLKWYGYDGIVSGILALFIYIKVCALCLTQQKQG